jgi:hypothetical protein
LSTQSVLVKVDLGQTFKSVFATVLNLGGGEGDVVKVDSADRREIFGLRWIARQDLADLVNDSVASGTERLDNLEFDGGGIKIVVDIALTGGNREKADSFTVKIETLADNVAWEENVLHWNRKSGSGSRGVGRGVGTRCVKGGKNGRTGNGTGGRAAGGILGTSVRGRPGRSSDRGGKVDGEHEVGSHRGAFTSEMATRAIGRLSGA